MLIQNALDALKDAKIDKRDWREVSGITNEILKSRAWRDKYENMSAWLEAAGEVSGYSSSILRRMVAVREFLERAKEEFETPEILQDTTTRAPFAAMELLKRIYDIDAERAKEVFNLIKAGNISHRAVQEIYSEMLGPSPFKSTNGTIVNHSRRSSGIRVASGSVQLAANIIQQNIQKLTGDAQARFYLREFKFAYTTPDAVALRYKNNGIAWLDGFKIASFSGGLPPSKRNQLIADIAFGSTFFRNYWIVLGKAGAIGASIMKDIHSLELHSIGVVEFDRDKPETLRVLLKPELSAQPDRQNRGIREVMSQPISGLDDF